MRRALGPGSSRPRSAHCAPRRYGASQMRATSGLLLYYAGANSRRRPLRVIYWRVLLKVPLDLHLAALRSQLVLQWFGEAASSRAVPQVQLLQAAEISKAFGHQISEIRNK